MEKESYSIDDILSEVKKRRESENKEQSNTEVQAPAQTKKQNQPIIEETKEEPKEVEAKPQFKEVIKEEKTEVKVSVAKSEPKKADVFIEKESKPSKSDTADIVIPTIEEEENGFTDTDEVEDNENVVPPADTCGHTSGGSHHPRREHLG